MKKRLAGLGLLALSIIFTAYLVFPFPMAHAANDNQLIYDEAGLLSQEDRSELNAMAHEYGAKRETDIIIFTSDNPEGRDVQEMTEEFYDEQAPGYDKAHGNAVILTLDLYHRDIYLAGFYKAEQYLDDARLDKIRSKITPDLSEGDYRLAFGKYIKTTYKYMGYKPGVNPDNILFNIWFQIGAAAAIAGIIVGIMAFRSGGRVTVSGRTYEDSGTSGVLDHQDRYIRTTTTKRKIEKNTGSGSGGGGTTKGGHSHSGSRGSF
ncbi:TPM domain-containing protein [Paenibacillus sp. SAF-054]|uniref:TPM domain-containing protein n=1 Tax=unclassified Paenibacillus TaxID=185978 RepID=UPI003F819EB0